MRHHYLNKIFREQFTDKKKSFWSYFEIKELTPELCLLYTF